MTAQPTAASVLRLVEGVPETAETFRALREIRAALADLVVIGEAAK
jgi:hypothetical protein